MQNKFLISDSTKKNTFNNTNKKKSSWYGSCFSTRTNFLTRVKAERYSRVGNTTASYPEGRGFES